MHSIDNVQLYSVTLLCSDGIRHVHISQDMLLQLVKSLLQNGKEIVYTGRGSYEVEGLIIGEIKDKILVL